MHYLRYSIFPSRLFTEDVPSILYLLVHEARNGSRSKKGKILFTFVHSLNSGYKGTTDSDFKETFYQYLKLVRLFSLIILINIGVRRFFSFSLSNFAAMKTSTYAPFAKPLYVMVKPVGAVCNLACDYCYYLEKANLYKDNPKHVMSDELLENTYAPALLLQKGYGTAKEIRPRTNDR